MNWKPSHHKCFRPQCLLKCLATYQPQLPIEPEIHLFCQIVSISHEELYYFGIWFIELSMQEDIDTEILR